MNIKIMGIYKITNKANGKFYIGSSNDIYRRWNEHKNQLKSNKHYNFYLQKAWNKYKEENFVFEIIEEVSGEDALLDIEQRWLDETNCYNPKIGYNLSSSTKGANIRYIAEREITDSVELDDCLYYDINKNVYDVNGNILRTVNSLNGLIKSLYNYYKDVVDNDGNYKIFSYLSNCILYTQDCNFNLQNVVESKTNIESFLKTFDVELIRIENYCHNSESLNIYKNTYVLYKIESNKLIIRNHFRQDEIVIYSKL